MKKIENSIFKGIVRFLTLFSVLILSFIIVFILKESIIFFKEVSIIKFIFGRKWNPLGSADKIGYIPYNIRYYICIGYRNYYSITYWYR